MITTPRQPYPVELLATEDERRLSIATGATKPLPASNVEECLDLLTEPRKVSVDSHKAFRESLTPAKVIDEIDEFLAELRTVKPEGTR